MSEFQSLLPNNSTPFEEALEQTVSRPVPSNLQTIWHPDNCPEHLLGVLAWGLAIEEWDDNWPLEVKRKVCRTAIEVHQHKGTVHAIKTALDSLNASIDLVEWFENGGQPYTATLVAYAADNLDKNGDTLLTPALQEKLWRVVNAAKNARTHIDFKVGVWVKNALSLTAAANITTVQRTSIKNDGSYPLSGTLFLTTTGSKPIEVHRHALLAV